MVRKYKGFLFKTKPWPHQVAALKFLYQRDAGALYTEPGTGKTKVMLDLIVNRGWTRGIIVAPSKACDVWAQQFKIHTDLQEDFIHNLAGVSTAEKVNLMNRLAPKGKRGKEVDPMFLIVNYEGIWRPKFVATLMRKSANLQFIICDESHRIKSPGSKCSMCLNKLGKLVPFRYLVTGTPLAENPLDVYAPYRFLDSSIFGASYGQFKSKYENLDTEKSMRVGFPIRVAEEPFKNLDDLKAKMFSCAFLVKSSVKLPKRKNVIVPYTLGTKAAKIYNAIDRKGVYVSSKGAIKIDAVISKSLRLQQVCSGVVPLDTLEGDTGRVEEIIDHDRAAVLEDLLESFDRREPVVVFAVFRHDFDEIQAVCKRTGRRYSEVSGVKDTLAAWKAGKTDVIAVQYKSGSESIDLTRARYCIYYSHTLSLALYQQSKKRIHRPGQTHDCVYYHIVARLPKKGAPRKSRDQMIIKALKLKQDVVTYILKQEKDGAE